MDSTLHFFSPQKLYRAAIAAYARAGVRHPVLYSLLPARAARKLVMLGVAKLVDSGEIHLPRQFLVDVSEVIKTDAKTGIQRVVRNILLQLLRMPPPGYEVRPVYASRHESYRYAERYRETLMAQGSTDRQDLPVQIRSGDIFLGLDLAAHLLPHHHRVLGQWKQSGAKLYFLIYDLFPVRRPEWFNPKRPKTFRRWLRTLAVYSDCILCISKTVADDAESWFLDRYDIRAESLPVRSFHLGSDFSDAAPASKLAVQANQALPRFQGQPFIMMVGTIEPRKGYAQALSAFELLWQQGMPINLVIFGKAGWKVEEWVSRLRQHPEAGVRLHWFENADDEQLLRLYRAMDGLLMASENEGFGLPVIEAARFNKPLLLRDIPVFREISGAGAHYFSGLEPDALASALHDWLSLISTGMAPSSQAIKCLNWAESTEQIVLSMELG